MIPASLTRKFDPMLLKVTQGNTYLAIEAFLDRLNEDPENVVWTSRATVDHFAQHPIETDSGKPQWVVATTVHLTINGLERVGTGGDVNFDPDTAMKSAQAMAFKKAANQFGIGAYILGKPCPERDLAELHQKALIKDSLEIMKQAVTLAAKIDGVSPLNADGIMDHYKKTGGLSVSVKSLEDVKVLDHLLRSRF